MLYNNNIEGAKSPIIDRYFKFAVANRLKLIKDDLPKLKEFKMPQNLSHLTVFPEERQVNVLSDEGHFYYQNEIETIEKLIYNFNDKTRDYYKK